MCLLFIFACLHTIGVIAFIAATIFVIVMCIICSIVYCSLFIIYYL